MTESGIFEHEPVLLDEVIEALSIKPGGVYVDGTFGRGGHVERVLEALDVDGRVIAIDKDPGAAKAGVSRFGHDPRFKVQQGSFASIKMQLDELGFASGVDGVLFDLGVSSPQLDDPRRGFSFIQDGPLDMRMNPADHPSASEWLATATPGDIEEALRLYGEERYARRIAKAIVDTRSSSPLVSTKQFAELIASVSPTKERHKHPATRSFQAIRIVINHELDELRIGLEQGLTVLRAGGRLVVISFHSLEDRIVKRFMRTHSRGHQGPRKLPLMEVFVKPMLRVAGGVVRPSAEECRHNPRARSAVMRVAERLA